MNEWKEKTLKDLVEVDPEQLPSSTDADFSFFYIDISSVSLGNVSFPIHSIQYKDAPSRARKILKDNDILMSTVRPNLKAFAPFRKSSKSNFIASTGFAVLRSRPNVEIGFIYHSLFSNEVEKQIEALVVGSNYPAINSGDVRNLKINIPSFPIQQKIAHILTTCDTVIEQTQSAIVKYKAIKQGLLHDLFTRGLDDNGKLRPTHHNAPELYKESEFGMIPKEWEVKRISELIKQGILDDIQDGNHGEIHPKSDDFVSVGIPFVMASDISKDILDIENCHKITKEQYQSLRIGFSKSGDILLSHKASIGFVARVPNFIKEIMLTPQVTYYRVLRENVLSTNYLEYFMRSDPFQNNLQLKAKQSTRDYIGITMQKTLYIEFPEDLKEQLQIANTCQSIQNKIQTEETLLQKYQSIKRGLMGDLLGGKKEVV